MDKKIEIYTTPTCAFCHAAKEYFKSQNLLFTEYDVSKDAQKRQEMVELVGQMVVPVIKIDGKIIVGFNRAKINELLGIS